MDFNMQTAQVQKKKSKNDAMKESFAMKDKLVFFLSHQYRLPIDDHTNRINQPLCLDVLRGDKNTLLKN